ncbi:MAG TPA: GFA family protein [Dongiaceae bacterium]|jgi:hypothetical protein|nr:GFA family protein [Dongiaceae bacterium]
MLYKGSCHCGHIAFEVEGELTQTVSCNCSICSRKGALLWAVPRDTLRLRNSEQGVGTYTFNNHAIAHRFCEACGIHPYAEDVAAGPERTAYINVRCLEGIEPEQIPVMIFDGRSM